MKTLSVAQARAQLSAHIDEVTRTHEVVTITRNGEPAAVLVSADEWESMEETLYWSEPSHAAELQAAIDEASHSEKMTLEEAFPEFVARKRKDKSEE
ncbi:MAG TPA: type II toxin-antitoxin system Phd/YefM family antitoxin [Mycobacteriales bacterium]|jgi:prevent-host-death family protein|nr:type II toxin-antitoxin system Phd/YefM family antitoxin [Mycobacteriales bacterium]